MSLTDSAEVNGTHFASTESKTAASVVHLPPLEADALWDAVARLIGDRQLETLAPDELVDLALGVPPLLPPELHRRIVEFRRRAPHGDVLLLRGLAPTHVEFQPTPVTSAAPVSGAAQQAAMLVLGVMSMFGEPFTYRSLWSGRLIGNMVPVRSMAFTQTSQSSSGMLDWHVEDGYREDRCDYVGLICLRGDPDAASQYAQAKDLRLAPDVVATLREARFQLQPDPAHDLPDDMPKRRITVLSGPDEAPEIVYDTHHISPIDDGDDVAADALRQLHLQLDEVSVSHAMSSGDLLMFDNKRVVHCRRPFNARFDGTDRWLMRVMVCGSAVTFRRWGERVPA